jgi:hypothetical protein
MNKILKTANVAEALEALASDSFVYNNPCCACGKQCSTPTKDIWMRRIKEFHSIEQMYAQYKCRNCRKAEPLVVIAKEPMNIIAPEPMIIMKPALVQMQAKKVELKDAPAPAPVKRQPMPGDAIKAPDKSIGTSIWETDASGALQYRGTQWYKILN